MMTIKHKPYGSYEKYLKRPLDIVLSASALLVLSPVMAVTAWQVRKKLGSPVVFTQLRPGKDEKIFKMYKFRTMTDERDADGNLLPDEVRLTPFGEKLRSSSLDELPELFNILKGDMSIVGPRPQLVRDMVFMTKEQRRRHKVAQGLTGLAQINGRNNISWEDKLNYDQKYVKHITFLGDLRILLCTVLNVLKKEDINTDGMATAEDFGDYLLRTGQVDRETYEKKQRIARRICEKNS
jgi:lipopolysaccharide/colanic/teichoic acid biosynthesis glycosyltransferase